MPREGEAVPGQMIGEEALFHASGRTVREGDLAVMKMGFALAAT